ncbi:Oligopeptidase A [Melia azedarach]|uniref:Oligopeptidase A n=1 Tax=Melia azedarach TaxID=155640 RepID=A0ACC1XT21_MELAZ|nr:Oligopeptidase A [Melia azedarach]
MSIKGYGKELYQSLHCQKIGFFVAFTMYFQWAEVLSADAFAVFEEVGFDDNEGNKETGCRFRDTILALGGGKEPLDISICGIPQAPTFNRCTTQAPWSINIQCMSCLVRSVHSNAIIRLEMCMQPQLFC